VADGRFKLGLHGFAAESSAGGPAAGGTYRHMTARKSRTRAGEARRTAFQVLVVGLIVADFRAGKSAFPGSYWENGRR
jgi:hypothetical protein